jgi:hypothetical protein
MLPSLVFPPLCGLYPLSPHIILALKITKIETKVWLQAGLKIGIKSIQK